MRLLNLFMVCLGVFFVNVADAWGESQSFDTEASATAAGWTGRFNTPAGGMGLDVGWRNSNIAGGTAGEAGGTMTWRSPGMGYYADTTLGATLSQSAVLHAEGRITVDSIENPDGAFEIGWFDESVEDGGEFGAPYWGGVPGFIGIRIAEPKEDIGCRVIIRVGDMQSEDRPEALVVGTDFFFTMDYDPNGDGSQTGRMDVRIADASDPENVYTDISLEGISWAEADPMTLDAFGLVSCDIADQTLQGADTYIDDLVYTYTFNRIPGDANNDSFVNELDAQILAENWLQGPGKLWFQGDFNGDTYVNDVDATILAANWSAGGEDVASAPEPGVIALGLLGLLVCATRRANRKN